MFFAAARAIDMQPEEKGETVFTVARGTGPRERWIARDMARETLSDARMASEGPRPTVKGAFFYRSAGDRF